MTKAELRESARQKGNTVGRTQTHLVIMGKFWYPCFKDGAALYDLVSGVVRAQLRQDGTWSEQVKEAAPKEQVKPLGPAVQVELTKGHYH
jgi:hypothetical protein